MAVHGLGGSATVELIAQLTGVPRHAAGSRSVYASSLQDSTILKEWIRHPCASRIQPSASTAPSPEVFTKRNATTKYFP